MRKEKGITLIALIMTIILLLILVGVSLNLLIKGDLFGSAEKAVSGTNAKVEEQQTRVDELMGQMDRANVFAEGTVPTLKYKVYGDNIIVYLEHSLYDYVSKMSIEEKEKKLANSISIESDSKYSNIDDFINDEFNGDRKYFEACLVRETGNYISYEEALNFCLMRSPYASIWFGSEFAENVLHLKNNLSVNEKEKRIANFAGWSLTQVQVKVQEEANNFGIPYSKCLDMYLNIIEMQELGEEEIEQVNRVTLTLPTGESGPFYYGAMGSGPRMKKQSYVRTKGRPPIGLYYTYYGMYIANVQTSGRYKYTAENYKGTKAEVTVPVELRTANFKVKVSDTETKTYEFIEGQSWGLFIGLENKYNVMSDNYAFVREDEDDYEDGYVVYAYYNLMDSKLKNERYKIASLNMPKLKVAKTDSTSERRLFKTDIILFALNKGKN